MKKMILMLVLTALACPVLAQPMKTTFPGTFSLIGRAIQKAMDKSAANKAEAERIAAAGGQVSQDANGNPVLTVSGQEYTLKLSDSNENEALNRYVSQDLTKSIVIWEGTDFSPEDINVYDQFYQYQNGLNPNDQIKAYYNFTEKDGTHHGYTIIRINPVNDSTYRMTEITHRMNHDVSLDDLKNEMMHDIQAIRELQPPLIKGQYHNVIPYTN